MKKHIIFFNITLLLSSCLATNNSQLAETLFQMTSDSPEILNQYLDEGSHLDQPFSNSKKPQSDPSAKEIFLLEYAVKKEWPQTTSWLIRHGADVNRNFPEGLTALILAARKNNMELVKILLDHGADPNKPEGEFHTQTNHSDNSPLALALRNENAEMATLLLKSGADPNFTRSRRGKPSLAIAIDKREPELTSLLLDHGANPDIVDKDDGYTAFMKAINPPQYDIIDMLAKAGGDINYGGRDIEDMVNNDAYTPLILAVKTGTDKMVEKLLSLGAEPNKPRSDNGKGSYNNGDTPLTTAVQYQLITTAEILLKAGADPNKPISNNGLTQFSHGATPLIYAVNTENSDMCKLLIKYKADVNQKSKGGIISPLSLSITLDNYEISKILLESGALLEKVDFPNELDLEKAIGEYHISDKLKNLLYKYN